MLISSVFKKNLLAILPKEAFAELFQFVLVPVNENRPERGAKWHFSKVPQNPNCVRYQLVKTGLLYIRMKRKLRGVIIV